MKHTLSKTNIILIAISFAIIVLGFFITAGEPSGADAYNPDIFSVRRVTIGPMISLFGFISLIFSILFNGKKK